MNIPRNKNAGKLASDTISSSLGRVAYTEWRNTSENGMSVCLKIYWVHSGTAIVSLLNTSRFGKFLKIPVDPGRRWNAWILFLSFIFEVVSLLMDDVREFRTHAKAIPPFTRLTRVTETRFFLKLTLTYIYMKQQPFLLVQYFFLRETIVHAYLRYLWNFFPQRNTKNDHGEVWLTGLAEGRWMVLCWWARVGECPNEKLVDDIFKRKFN